MSNSSDSLPYQTELLTALRAVHLASLLTKSHLLNHLSSSKNPAASTKSDDSEVTTADFSSQAVIIGVLHHVFPDDVFIAEESGEMLRSDGELRGRVWDLFKTAKDLVSEDVDGDPNQDWGIDVVLPGSVEEMVEIIDLGQIGGMNKQSGNGTRRTWILDPIDGTKTYIRGQQYCVCLCLVEHGEQQVAVFGCPNVSIEERDGNGRVRVEEGLVDLREDGGLILSCVKGTGVGISKMEKPWEVKRLEDVAGWDSENGQTDGKGVTETPDGDNNESAPLTLRFTDSAASPHTSQDIHQKIFQHFASSPDPVTPLDIWSMQLKYVLLTLRASGADALIRTPPMSDYHASVWDHAGGQLLLRESGGYLTDAMGAEFLLDGSMRNLERNWGVCAVRGGGFLGRDGEGMDGGVVHGVLRGIVGGLVRQRERDREGKKGQGKEKEG